MEDVELVRNDRWYTGYFLSNLAGGLTNPLITLYVVSYLGLGVFYVGLASSLASAASVPALLFWGNISDRIKKRKIFILIGFYGAFASLMGILLAHNIWEYIAVLMVFQVLVMASVPVSTLIIMENSAEKSWATTLSKFNAISASGTLAGLLSGAVMVIMVVGNDPGYLPMFYVIAGAFYAMASIAVSLTIPEPKKNISRKKLWKLNSIRIFERARFLPSNVIHFVSPSSNNGRRIPSDLRLYLFSTTFLMFGFQLFFVAFPVFVLEMLGADQGEIFFMYLANALGSVITFRYAGMLSQKYGDRKLTALALLGRVIIFLSMGGLAVVAIHSLLEISVAIVAYGTLGGLWSFIGLGQLTGVSRLAGKTLRGKAIGYYNSFNGVAQIVAGFSGGIVALYAGYGSDFVLAAIIVLSGSGLALRLTAGKRVSREVSPDTSTQ